MQTGDKWPQAEARRAARVGRVSKRTDFPVLFAFVRFQLPAHISLMTADMMEFKFACPSCGQHILATEAYSGEQVDCPACQAPMVVPQASETSPTSAATTHTSSDGNNSKTRWIAICSAAGLLVAVSLGLVLLRGVLSHARTDPTRPLRAQTWPDGGVIAESPARQNAGATC